jgi:uncharacterized protein (DUF1810 family)
VNLQRFLDAQAGVIDTALEELVAGRKRTHWMWFVFPQLAALGRSATAKHYGLADLCEAKAYLAHPVLGERVRSCTRAVLAHRGATAHAIFGSPDERKFRSCMTLFHLADPAEPLFAQALAQFFEGRADPLTMEACGQTGGVLEPPD